MNTSKHTISNDDEVAREIVSSVQMATHAFDGVDLPDHELDQLCEAVLSHNCECIKRSEVRRGLDAARDTPALPDLLRRDLERA